MARMDKESAPVLVSVCVITYNSSRTVIETLDSIYEQSYPRLELIISDDCSVDDTVEICRKWLETHSDRFEDTAVIRTKQNGGVAANLNCAIRATKGEWLKYIAGDDLLLPDCISDNMAFVRSNENDGIIFSNVRQFYVDAQGNRILTDVYQPAESAKQYYDKSAQEQYNRILSVCFTPSNSVFWKRSLAVAHPFLEQYPYNEDDPQWLHLTKEGIKLSFFDKTTVLYRIGDSLSKGRSGSFVGERYHYSCLAYLYADRYFELLKRDPQRAKQLQKEFFLGDVAIILLKNKKNFFTRAILYLFKLLVGTRKIS